MTLHRFRFIVGNNTPSQTLLTVGGMTLSASCGATVLTVNVTSQVNDSFVATRSGDAANANDPGNNTGTGPLNSGDSAQIVGNAGVGDPNDDDELGRPKFSSGDEGRGALHLSAHCTSQRLPAHFMGHALAS